MSPILYSKGMGIEISRREVFNNLVRIKDRLLDMHQGNKKRTFGKERNYQGLLNVKTGDIRFPKKITFDLEPQRSLKIEKEGELEDWIEIHLRVREGEEGKEGVQFALLDERDRELKPAALAYLTWRILSETLNVLNEKGRECKEISPDALPEEEVLSNLSSIHLIRIEAQIENAPGWAGRISRMEAEERLNKKPPGTYLLREGDPITCSIAFHLSEEEHSFVYPYIVAFVDTEGKASEAFLLHTHKGWLLYSDDPDLRQSFYHFYSTPQQLLETLCPFARYPLNFRREN